MKAALLAAAAAMGLAASSQATLIVYEPFDYPAGGLTGNGGGTGFSGNWLTETSRITGNVVSPGASYTDGTSTLQVAGNMDRPSGSARNWRALSSAVDLSAEGSTAWISFLAKAHNNTAGGGHFGVALFNYDGTGYDGTELATLGKGASTENWGIAAATAGFSTVSATTDALLVYKLTRTATNVGVQVWVNPSLSSESNLGAASATGAFVSATTFNWVRASTSQTGTSGYIDEIRIGTTFGDVAPIPEPGTICLAAGALGLLAGRRRRA